MSHHDFQSGALPDTRTEEEKKKDYKFEELVASVNPVNWIEKSPTDWRSFPIFQQDGSGSCVAQTMAKLLGILYWLKNQVYVHFSATHVYQRRSNKPAAGMAGVDAFNIARDGVTLEVLVPSQDMTDTQMDETVIEQYKKDVGTVFKIPNYVQPPIQDIETIASIIQTTKKAVMVWFYFKIDEWTTEPSIKYPNLLNDSNALRHSVAAVDFTLYKGKKCLIIEDSWGTSHGMAGRRIVSEDFFNKRNFFAAYPMAFVFEEGIVKPTYDGSIKSLQDCLKHYGTFPTNVESTGFYGPVTIKAVNLFQVKEGLHPTGTGIVGPQTTTRLKLLYP